MSTPFVLVSSELYKLGYLPDPAVVEQNGRLCFPYVCAVELVFWQEEASNHDRKSCSANAIQYPNDWSG